MGYVRGVVHGAVVGAVVALLVAPQPGTATRRRVSSWLSQVEELLTSEPAGPEAEAARGARPRSASGRFESRTR